jgi:ABC-2 type transport system ATP-binding protein
MSGLGVQATDLSVSYGAAVAVDRVSFTLQPGRIYGLLGRNGSGKSSLMAVLAGFRKPSSGRVLIDGDAPFENARVMAGSCLIRESGDVVVTSRVRAVLSLAAALRPHWDGEFAARLLDQFALAPDTRVDALSRGQRSALAVVLGLAARSPLTMLDEVYLGMDAPTRYAFYDELLADYVEHPRTIILSSHLIDEIERLFEGVLVLHEGRLLVDEDADDIRGRGLSVTGPAIAVDGFVEALAANGGRTLGSRQLGATKQVTILAGLDGETRERARRLGLDLGPVPLQDLFVHLTDGAHRSSPAVGADDRFIEAIPGTGSRTGDPA